MRPRLVLFDIDGTLLSASGVSGRSLGETLHAVVGDTGPIHGFDFSGKTDPQIVRELMTAAGFAPEVIAERRPHVLRRYESLLAERLRPEHVQAKPGAVEVVERLAGRDGIVLGLLTGNLERCARLKLDPLGLNPHLPFGAFGSDHEDRYQLTPFALERARRATGLDFHGTDVVIVGDSVHDVRCGRAWGVRAVAVATGRTPAAALQEAGADALLPDMSDVDATVRAVLG